MDVKTILKPFIKKNQNTDYDLLNDQLYTLCSKNFKHDTDDKILAKTLLIGRTYSVALDRGKDKGKTIKEKRKQKNIDFYKEVVVPIFKDSKIDIELKKFKNCNEANLTDLILKTHKYLMGELSQINHEDKRSFCSKYLHFHLPKYYFIYDVRSKSAINNIVPKKYVKNKLTLKYDNEYEVFYFKCLHCLDEIEKKFKIDPRKLDNILLAYYNEM